MKSYSNAVADTNLVQELDVRLSKELAAQQLTFAQTIAAQKAENEKAIKGLRKHALITDCTLLLVLVGEIVQRFI